MKKFIFDVDGTLTPSRCQIDPEFLLFMMFFETRIDVYLVDSSEIKDLNYKFLNNNYETDVLSFNFYEGWKDGSLEKSESLFPGEKSEEGIGEIYISIPKIKSQAKENSVSFAKELSTMAIHGALHLLGYNHEEILEEKIMFSKTEKILNKVISE